MSLLKRDISIGFWVAVMVALAAMLPAQALLQRSDCCEGAASQHVEPLRDRVADEPSVASDSCCDHTGRTGSEEPFENDQDHPSDQTCDCTCCGYYSVASNAPLFLTSVGLTLDPSEFTLSMPVLCPESTVLSVDIQPPIA